MCNELSEEFSFFDDCKQGETNIERVAISLTTGTRRQEFKDLMRFSPDVSTGFKTRSRRNAYTCNCLLFQSVRFPCPHIIKSMQRRNLKPDRIAMILKASMHPFFNVHKLVKFFNQRESIVVESCTIASHHRYVQTPMIDLTCDQSDEDEIEIESEDEDEVSENVIWINPNLTMQFGPPPDQRLSPQKTRERHRGRRADGRSRLRVNRHDAESSILDTRRRAGTKVRPTDVPQVVGRVQPPRSSRRFN